MRLLRSFVIYLFILLPVFALAQPISFNVDSANAYLEHLSVTIGPRPMGSANDRLALNWAVNKFNSFGADTAYVMVFTQAKTNRQLVNTNSGISVGLFRGETDSTIVIGGHIDSSGREIPGANDDASGTASVIELARIWSQRPRYYTMVFAAFGGEEQGLIGSKYFVAHYPNLDKVALMLQIDMVGSEDKLITFLETDRHQAPQWLVRDVFTSARQLGLNNLQYPTHFFSINNALPGGGAGSDHQPFLDKNIPAIDFTVGVNNSPIHTPQDKFDNINKSMMQRCGLLVDGLLTKYQEQKIPTPRKGEYMLWQLFSRPFFIPSWLVLSTVVIGMLLGTWAFIHSRKNRLIIEKSQRVRFSGLKLFTLMLIMAIFTQLGEAIMQFIKGLRYPWLVHIDKYLWFAAIWSVAGIWVSLQITRKWRFSPDPYVYTKRALILLFALIILLGMASVRLTLYPAITLLFISLAIFIPIPFIKFILSLIAPLPMFKLMFMETFPFLAHNASLSGFIIDTFWRALFYSIALTILLVIWYLPVIYLLSYSLINFNPFKNILKRFRSPAFGVIILLAILGYGVYLNSFPSYNELWRAAIHVDADYDARSGESKLQLIGNEYFRNVRVTSDSLHKQFDERKHKTALSHSFQANWIDISGDEAAVRGEKDTVNINWLLTSNHPWYRIILKIQVDTLEISDVHSDLIFNHQKDRITFTWYADPPDTLHVATSFTMYPGAKLTREVSAIFPEMPMPINVTAELADVRYRTTVTFKDTLDLLFIISTK